LARLLVTGGAGYIGSHVLRTLRRAGHSVLVFDDLRSGRDFLVRDAPLVCGDVCDPNAVSKVFADHGPFDAVLHFAALISAPESVAEPLRYYRNNVVGSTNLLHTALEQGTRAFVLSSTAAVYGHPEQQPIPESAPLAPINPYGASKMMVERMLPDLETSQGLRWAALRYFNACGADPAGDLGECHDPETHLIPLALEAAAGLRPTLRLYGTDYPTRDGTCIRDYVHVTDLADAHALALEALLRGRSVGARNLGSGHGHTNREVLAAVERVVGQPVPVEEAPRRRGDAAVLVADAARFGAEFGWEPRHSQLDSIVATAWAWLARWRKLRS
jgi:UDP-glucose-4-epimerase GalE